MKLLDKRLNDSGKNWRHVFKALTLLDYLVHLGSEQVVTYTKENIYIVKTLREFQYIDEFGKDQGQNVRHKAKELTALLSDDERLREERSSRLSMRDRITGRAADSESRYSSRSQDYHGSSAQEDRDLERALAESRRLAEEQQTRSPSNQMSEEEQLRRAIELSMDEEEKRKKRENEKNDMIDFSSNDYQNANANAFHPFDQPGTQAFRQNSQTFDTFGNPYQNSSSMAPMQFQQQQQSFDPFSMGSRSNTAPPSVVSSGNNQFNNSQFSNSQFNGSPRMNPYYQQNSNSMMGSPAMNPNNQFMMSNPLSCENPIAALGNIAKNSPQIDPFSSISVRSQSTGMTSFKDQRTGSSLNPFSSTTNGSNGNLMDVGSNNNAMNSFNGAFTSNTNEVPKTMVDLDNLLGAGQPNPAAMPSFSAAFNKNPFASGSGQSSGSQKMYDWGNTTSAMQPAKNKSLNELGVGGGSMNGSPSMRAMGVNQVGGMMPFGAMNQPGMNMRPMGNTPAAGMNFSSPMMGQAGIPQPTQAMNFQSTQRDW